MGGEMILRGTTITWK